MRFFYIQAAQPPVEWLWTNRLPRRHISLITGSAGSGKSLIVLDWLSRWLLNRPMPDGQFLNHQGETAVLCVGEAFFPAYAEQIQAWQEARLWPRGKTGIYLHRQLHKSKEYQLNNQTAKLQLIDFAAGQEQDRLTRLVDRHRPELLIIDTISSTFTETTLAKDVKEALEFIFALSGEYNLCTIMVYEDNKQQSLKPQPDINNGIGLGAFTSFSRSIFTLHHEKLSNSDQVDHKEDLHILSPIKHNFARPDPIGVWFRAIHPSGVRIEYCPVERVYARTANVRKEKKE